MLDHTLYMNEVSCNLIHVVREHEVIPDTHLLPVSQRIIYKLHLPMDAHSRVVT